MTAQTDLNKIRKIVANTDDHRTRSRRDAWEGIKAVLTGDSAEEPEPAMAPEAVVDDPAADVEPPETEED